MILIVSVLTVLTGLSDQRFQKLSCALTSSQYLKVNNTFLSIFSKGKHVYMRSSSIDGSEIGGCINEFENFIDVYTLCIKRASFQTEDDVPPMEPFITTKAHIFLHDVLLANKKYYQEKSNSKSPVKCFLEVYYHFGSRNYMTFLKDRDNQ